MKGEPKDIALAFSVGVFIAFFPILGTHTALAFALAWAFRVSPTITLGASFVNNPWTIIPIYLGSLYFGAFITNTEIGGVTHEVNDYLHNPKWEVFLRLAKDIGVPFVAGCLILGTIFAVIAYFIVLRMVQVYRARKGNTAPGAQ